MLQDLHQAVADGDTEHVRAILSGGADVNARKHFGCPTPIFDVTPLMVAAETGNARVVSLLLESGADPNLQDIGGWTPLMRAAAYGNKALVQILLAHGADAEYKNNAGDTASSWAAGEDAAEIEMMLKSAQ